jgi:hypothetical protein
LAVLCGIRFILCPFAEYYVRYAVTSFFTISRISFTDGKRAGQKVQRKIAGAVQNVKPSTFCPALLKSKITINVPLFKKMRDIIFFLRDNNFLSRFKGHFEGAKTFLTP